MKRDWELGTEFTVKGKVFRVARIAEEPNTGLVAIAQLNGWSFTVPYDVVDVLVAAHKQDFAVAIMDVVNGVTHWACMQAAFRLIEALGVQETPFCCACEHEPLVDPVEDICSSCGEEGFMSTYYGPSEARMQENDLATMVMESLRTTAASARTCGKRHAIDTPPCTRTIDHEGSCQAGGDGWTATEVPGE